MKQLCRCRLRPSRQNQNYWENTHINVDCVVATKLYVFVYMHISWNTNNLILGMLHTYLYTYNLISLVSKPMPRCAIVHSNRSSNELKDWYRRCNYLLIKNSVWKQDLNTIKKTVTMRALMYFNFQNFKNVLI